MATNFKWAVPNGVQTLLTTGLDGLTNSSWTTSSAYNNTSNLDLYADFILAIAYGTAPAAGTKVGELYLVPAVDGTNYATQDANGQPQLSLLIGTFESRLPSTSVLEYLVINGVSIPPLNMKFAFKNTSGQTLKDNSISKFLKMQPYQLQGV